MPEYKLTYFEARGAGEQIRQIFAASGTPFEDIRVSIADWTPEKKGELGLEWGQLPILEIDGVRKAQSHSICRYLGKKFNLVGKDEDEQFRVDEVCEAVRDYLMKGQSMFATMFGNDPEEVKLAKLEEQKKQFKDVDTPLHLTRFNKLLEKQGTTWLVGKSLTIADIIFVNVLDQFQLVFTLELVKDYPEILKLFNAVRNEPKIKAWIETRPKTMY